MLVVWWLCFPGGSLSGRGEEEVKYDDNASIVVWIDARSSPLTSTLKLTPTGPNRSLEIVDRASFGQSSVFNNAARDGCCFAEPNHQYNADEAHDYHGSDAMGG